MHFFPLGLSGCRRSGQLQDSRSGCLLGSEAKPGNPALLAVQALLEQPTAGAAHLLSLPWPAASPQSSLSLHSIWLWYSLGKGFGHPASPTPSRPQHFKGIRLLPWLLPCLLMPREAE